MEIRKVKLGIFIEPLSKKCGISDLTIYDVSGINRNKEFFEPSKQVGKDTSNYKLVPPNYFACNLMHIGRDVVLPIALNNTSKDKYVSPAYTVFKIADEDLILSKYLFMLLKSNEKDRYFWFHCDSSVRDGMDWDTFCDVEIDIPPIEIQKKYVAVYESLLHNLKIYESKLEDLRLICDGFIEEVRRNSNNLQLSEIAKIVDNRNDNECCSNVKGLTVYKEFIKTKADLTGVSLKNYKIVEKGEIAFVPTTNRNGDRLACAISDDRCIVSQIYEVLQCSKKICNPYYIFMWFRRKEMDRYARFISWGTARENLTWDDLGKYLIPIPSIDTQNIIVDMFNVVKKRQVYVDKLKQCIQNICPILIKGSIEECR